MLVATIAVTAMMALGLLDMPYGYYMLIRVVTCGAAAWFAFELQDTDQPGTVFGLIGMAILYNPVLPVHLGDKGIWAVVNLLTLVFLWKVTARSRT